MSKHAGIASNVWTLRACIHALPFQPHRGALNMDEKQQNHSLRASRCRSTHEGARRWQRCFGTAGNMWCKMARGRSPCRSHC
eukprot:2192764-Amphidinium_carterae.1